MYASASLLSLPASFLSLLIAHSSPACSTQLQWPYNLPEYVKYFPEDEAVVKRDFEIQKRLQYESPVGVQKMSGDPGEKFYMHYWEFAEVQDSLFADGTQRLRRRAWDQAVDEWSNGSMTIQPLPAFPLHDASQSRQGSLMKRSIHYPRGLFDKRGFTCPANTHLCTNIGRSDICCGTGETCEQLSSGVGCCDQNQQCSGEIGDCAEGDTVCSEFGGGCCLPGFSCVSGGCELLSLHEVTKGQPS